MLSRILFNRGNALQQQLRRPAIYSTSGKQCLNKNAASVRSYASVKPLPPYVRKEQLKQKRVKKAAEKRARLATPPVEVTSNQGTVLRPPKPVKQLRKREIKKGNARHGDPSNPPRKVVRGGDPVKSQRIMFPNVQLTLVRNAPTPTGVYNPWVATFRCSRQLTKPDIVSYLTNIYGLKITSINTTITAPLHTKKYGQTRVSKSYKKVIVGLEQPFWYPEEKDNTFMEEYFTMQTRHLMQQVRMKQSGELKNRFIGKPTHGYRGNHPYVRGVGSGWRSVVRKVEEQRALENELIKKEASNVASRIVEDKE